MQMAERVHLETFVRTCRDKAVQMCLDFQNQGFQSSHKVDQTWVTDADLAIERELRKMIGREYPDHAILGEEEGGEGIREEGYTWILDPIDGTFSFVNHVPFYSSLIAVLKDGQPFIGSAALPEMGWSMMATRGCGAVLNDQAYVPPHPSSRKSEILAIADPYRFAMEGYQEVLRELMSEPFRIRTYPDSLGYFLLLKGAVRGFVDPKTEIWDTAPFHVILPEAGFRICSWRGVPDLCRGAVVSDHPENPDDRVLQLLRRHARDPSLESSV